jgi:hypothetical protein
MHFSISFHFPLSSRKINVASGCTCCFPEEEKGTYSHTGFCDPSDIEFYFLAALCKLLVDDFLFNLQLGLRAA